MEQQNVEEIKKSHNGENGTTTIIALLIMMLLMGFVTFAITRSANETLAVSNEISETKALFAAQASVENMALKADARFEQRLTLTNQDVADIQASLPDGYTDYSFTQSLTKAQENLVVPATGSTFQGLQALRDEWQFLTTARDLKTDVKVTLRRRVFNDRVPIFQFGIFYNDDANNYGAATTHYFGRVHTNGNLFVGSGSTVSFYSKVTAAGQIITDVAPTGASNPSGNTYFQNGASVLKLLDRLEGSALSSPVSGANLMNPNFPNRPAVYRNANWDTIKARFNGNLLADQPKLNLPIKTGYRNIIVRGRNTNDKYNNGTGTASSPTIVTTTTTPDTRDDQITRSERFYNKTGIRITLADFKNRLPGCANATVSTPCGVQLDSGSGYQPIALKDGSVSTKMNGGRLSSPIAQNWIKIELVESSTTGEPTTTDVTEDVLSLGVTERMPSITNFSLTGYGANSDKYSIVQMQRFVIPYRAIVSAPTNWMTTFNDGTNVWNYVLGAEAVPAPSTGVLTANRNPIATYPGTNAATSRFGCYKESTLTCSGDNSTNMFTATIGGVANRKIVPFPISFFDTREGMPYESGAPNPTWASNSVPYNGLMSGVDINVGNLRSLLNGSLDSLLPNTGTTFSSAKGRALKATDFTSDRGWVVYVSDRRGDYDFDGQYDMEDIFASGSTASTLNDGVLNLGEDVNGNGTLEAEYTNEAVKYNEFVPVDVGATISTRFFRRAVRLVNGVTLPGNYNSANEPATEGFTVASENPVYVVGNYNSTGVTGSAFPATWDSYQPQGTATHVPASVIADSITLLSNNWRDDGSFKSPNDLTNRVAADTYYRFATIAGDNLSFSPCVASAGGSYPCYEGGVNNLNRYMESWSGKKMYYSGSIVNLFNSLEANGYMKCCTTGYTPPSRNFTFENSFLNPYRIPPGTPYIQSIRLTGFERIND